MKKQSIIWYREHVTDLRKQMNLNKLHRFDSVVVHICNPLFKREFEKVRHSKCFCVAFYNSYVSQEPMKKEHQLFTRCDLILSPLEW